MNKGSLILLIKAFINFVFVLILLSVFLVCIYQNSTYDATFKKSKKICADSTAWAGPFGVLSAYSVFLKENLFKDNFHENVLVIPVLNKAIPELNNFGRFLALYLFPVKIEAGDSQGFCMDEKTFKNLKVLPLITKEYRKKQYHLVCGLKAEDYKKWAIYTFSTKNEVDIFTLPMDWQGLKKGN